MLNTEILEAALDKRAGLFDPRHEAAFRLFNGLTEGCPALVADLYGQTLVLHNYADPPAEAAAIVAQAAAFYRAHLPWLRAVLVKARYAERKRRKRGVLLWGKSLTRRVRENGCGTPWTCGSTRTLAFTWTRATCASGRRRTLRGRPC